jgi:hypothetical protein
LSHIAVKLKKVICKINKRAEIRKRLRNFFLLSVPKRCGVGMESHVLPRRLPHIAAQKTAFRNMKGRMLRKACMAMSYECAVCLFATSGFGRCRLIFNCQF